MISDEVLNDMSEFGLDKSDIDYNGYVTLYHGGKVLPDELNKDEIFFMTPSYEVAEDYARMRKGEVFTLKVKPEDVSWNHGSSEVEFDKGGVIINDVLIANKNENQIMKFKNFIKEQHEYHKILNPKFWTNFQLDERVREKLLIIAQEFYKSIELDVPIDDIILTGSLCNFNYTQYSDLDVHIIIDFSKAGDNQNLVTDYFDIKGKFYNQRHNITIRGFEVELYIQDINATLAATAVYSLQDNKWLIKPKHNPPKVDLGLVMFKYQTYKSGIDEFYKRSKMDLTPEQANANYQYSKRFKKKISNMRKESLQKDGEFSVGNLVFKQLRNQGDFGRLMDSIAIFYDKIYIQ